MRRSALCALHKGGKLRGTKQSTQLQRARSQAHLLIFPPVRRRARDHLPLLPPALPGRGRGGGGRSARGAQRSQRRGASGRRCRSPLLPPRSASGRVWCTATLASDRGGHWAAG